MSTRAITEQPKSTAEPFRRVLSIILSTESTTGDSGSFKLLSGWCHTVALDGFWFFSPNEITSECVAIKINDHDNGQQYFDATIFESRQIRKGLWGYHAELTHHQESACCQPPSLPVFG